MKYFFAIFFSVFGVASMSISIAQQKDDVSNMIPDSTIVEWKQFDENVLNEIVQKGGFEYMNETVSSGNYLGILDALLAWFDNLLKNAPETSSSSKKIDIYRRDILYGISMLIVVVVIVGIFRNELRSLFYSGSQKIAPQAFWSEKELPLDLLEKERQEAIELQDFKRAIRLSYIIMLKKLAERGYIRWKIDKTNHEYEVELVHSALKKHFQKATYYYEYICYGEFRVDRELFEKAIETIERVIVEKNSA